MDNCGLYFKLRLGTGWDTESLRCPYCRAEGHPSDFLTQDQLDYATSVAARDVVGPLLQGFKRDVERMTAAGEFSMVTSPDQQLRWHTSG